MLVMYTTESRRAYQLLSGCSYQLVNTLLFTRMGITTGKTPKPVQVTLKYFYMNQSFVRAVFKKIMLEWYIKLAWDLARTPMPCTSNLDNMSKNKNSEVVTPYFGSILGFRLEEGIFSGCHHAPYAIGLVRLDPCVGDRLFARESWVGSRAIGRVSL